MTRHLQSCLSKSLESQKKQGKTGAQPFFHILVKGFSFPEYWLHLKTLSNAKLADLDRFLREIWLACCGHMSAFSFDREELPMAKKLKDVLQPGMELLYEYDFGSTTDLSIRAIAQYEGPMEKGKKVEVLARNEPPEIMCEECGKHPAVQICTECQWDEGGWLCQECAENHECGEDMMLPVVNSPRTGVCGYVG
jgi:hypothetical protein